MIAGIAKLNKFRMSPRKVRLVADMIRGMKVDNALSILSNDNKKASLPLNKLLLSSISNWRIKNNSDIEDDTLYIKKITVDSAGMLKRIKPAPQGRAHRIRKRYSHISIIVNTNEDGSINANNSKTSDLVSLKSADKERVKTIKDIKESNKIGNNSSINSKDILDKSKKLLNTKSIESKIANPENGNETSVEKSFTDENSNIGNTGANNTKILKEGGDNSSQPKKDQLSDNNRKEN